MKAIASTGELCPESEDFGPVKPFLDHLEDLRWLLIRCFIALVISMLLCLTAADQIIGAVMEPLEQIRQSQTDENTSVPTIEQRGPSSPFSVAMKTTFYGGIAVALPMLLAVLGVYVQPALKPLERTILSKSIAWGIGLFLLGAATAYFIVVPMILRASIQFSAWLGLNSSVWFVDDYVGFVLRLLLGLGLAFEIPIALWAVVRLGIVDIASLRRARPYAIIANLIVAAWLTPTDFTSCLALGIPLHLLFEISLLAIGWGTNAPTHEAIASTSDEPPGPRSERSDGPYPGSDSPNDRTPCEP
ncbi:MAG: twin-arginine translocase subunit TatC [Limisphaerales bacterium]